MATLNSGLKSWQQSISSAFLTSPGMYNITLVCTHHSELGKCNSDELYKIIRSIKPDVIFEELPEELFDKFYKENSIPFETPEIKSVRRYIEDQPTSHIPVDIHLSDPVSKHEIDYLFHIISKYTAYLKLEEEQEKLIFQEGFDFLNSERNEELTERKQYLQKSLIEFHINKRELSRIYELFHKEQRYREDQIIKNIYNYSKKTAYNQGVLLLGSGHRKTIIEKIGNYDLENNVNVKWTLYGN